MEHVKKRGTAPMATTDLVHRCLYFNASKLARTMNRLAEEQFLRLGLAPSHAFLVMLVDERPGISQKEIAEELHLTQSTITRFIDTLVAKGLVERKSEAKLARVYATPEGKRLYPELERAWRALHARYCGILGEQEGDDLAKAIDEASERLNSG